MVKAKITFAAIPARAVGDPRLKGLHLKVLGAVALHDRFNKNGKGCCASHPRLAGLAKCHLKSLSRSLKVLAECGYIEGLPSPFNKRQRAYRVVYNDADRAIMTNPIGNNPATYQDADEGEKGNNPATETDPIGNKDFLESEQNQELLGHNIFSETGKRFSETVKESSAEAAPPYGDAKDLLGKEEPDPDRIPTTGNTLGKIQTWLKSLEGKQLTESEVDELHQLRTICEQVEEEHGLDGVGPWAQRLAIDIGILLDEPDDEDDEPFFPEDRASKARVFTTTKTTGDGEFIGEPRRFTVLRAGIPIRVGVRTTMRREPEARDPKRSATGGELRATT